MYRQKYREQFVEISIIYNSSRLPVRDSLCNVPLTRALPPPGGCHHVRSSRHLHRETLTPSRGDRAQIGGSLVVGYYWVALWFCATLPVWTGESSSLGSPALIEEPSPSFHRNMETIPHLTYNTNLSAPSYDPQIWETAVAVYPLCYS